MSSAATAPDTSTAPDLEVQAPLTHRQIVTILTGLMMGMFLAALDQTIVASAIRVIADDLQNLQGQAWATTAYLVTSTIVTPCTASCPTSTAANRSSRLPSSSLSSGR